MGPGTMVAGGIVWVTLCDPGDVPGAWVSGLGFGLVVLL